MAPQLQLPPQAEFAKLWGEWADLFAVLSQQLPPADLSDESVMAVYHAIEKTGGIDKGLPVAQVRQLFGDGGFVRSASALSAALGEQADKVDVEVNPRYRPLGVPAWVNKGQELVFYALPYIDATGPVTDVSTPDPVASPTPAQGPAASLSTSAPDRPAGHLAPVAGRSADRRRLGRRAPAAGADRRGERQVTAVRAAGVEVTVVYGRATRGAAGRGGGARHGGLAGRPGRRRDAGPGVGPAAGPPAGAGRDGADVRLVGSAGRPAARRGRR